MNDKKLIKQLQSAYDVNPKNKIRFIRKINNSNTSILSFIFNQFKLISYKAYLFGFVYFIILLVLLLSSNNHREYIVLVAGMPFFSLLFIGIVDSSRANNMSEIEMATLYSLKMVIIARMIIMSFITMTFIIVMSILTSRLNNISITMIICHFFIPYFLNMYLNLKLLKRYKKEGFKYCFVLSSITCLLILFLFNNPSFVLPFSFYGYIGVLIILIVLSIKECVNYIYGLENYVWNLN